MHFKPYPTTLPDLPTIVKAAKEDDGDGEIYP
jgi:hypothetical protein